MKSNDIHENVIVRIITFITNLVILNLIFLACSLPIFTVGASASALIYTAKKLKEKDDVVLPNFFFALKDNFKQSTKSFLIFLMLGILLGVEGFFLLHMNIKVPPYIFICLMIPVIAYTAYLPWLFIISVYFICNLGQQLKNAAILSVKLLPQTVIMALMMLFPLYLLIFKIVTFLRVWPLWLFLYFSICGMVSVFITDTAMENIKEQFNKYE